ncbi:hypothetical protein K9M74_04020 [Candidatus Woesearchaeota archaeon]|nr:hypothetical protein [Candidatus Woesearchaeota archaeon]
MKKTIFILLLSGISLLLVACALTLQSSTDGVLTDFEECIIMGGTIIESNPLQCFYGNQSFTELINVTKSMTALVQSCEVLGGNWIATSAECEGISQVDCEQLGGNFNSFALACRNDPNALVCTKQCVFVCEFNINAPSQDYFQIPSGCTSWFDGCNTCVVKNGATTACTEIYCEPASYTKPTCLSFENSISSSQEEIADIPLNCKTWFDGCNVCFVNDGELAACTRKHCPSELMEEPECKEYIEE